MQPSPLQLEGYFLKELSISLTSDLADLPSGEEEYDDPRLEIGVSVDARDGDTRRWRCELTVASEEAPKLRLPYTFRVSLVGFFRVLEGFPEAHVESMVRANGPALLYSAVREILWPLTARGPVPGLLLPSVTFIQPPASAPKKKAATPAKTQRKKAAKKTG